MPTPPIPQPLRAAAGLAAVAIDSARKLPEQLVGFPVLAVSAALQASLKAQQRYAELVVRGDQLLEQLRGHEDGNPAWARFDDEVPAAAVRRSAFDLAEHADDPAGPLAEDDHEVEDLLASGEEDAEALAEASGDAAGGHLATEPPVPGYDALAAGGQLALSIAQLRGRLRSLSADQVEALVAYERATRQRPPFMTMLDNRLATLRSR
jgi:hypothetical protein